MEDYERELYGVEDDFHSQFAAELEVLAELEGGSGSRRGPDGVLARPWEPARAFRRRAGERRRGVRGRVRERRAFQRRRLCVEAAALMRLL